MNKKIRIPLLLLYALLFTTLSFSQNVTKRGLIIAIADYPDGSGWMDISSDKDIDLIKNSLSKQNFTDINVVTDQDATKDGIISAIEELTDKSEKNDIVVIHFSNHGQQIFDDNNDEIDGLDESIVCYGAEVSYSDTYKGEQHLRDDKIGELLTSLRLKLGAEGNVLVILDACHSGTGTRGVGVVRGGKKPFVPEGYGTKEIESDLGYGEAVTGGGSDSLAPLVIYSAARANELNFEYKGYGSLSYSVSKAFENLSPEMTYRALFAKIKTEMAEVAVHQNPVAEGEGLNNKLFGGETVTQQEYYTIDKINSSKKELTINAGTLSGIYEESVFDIFPSGTVSKEGARKITSGKIVKSDYFTSVLEVESMEGVQNKASVWAFLAQKSYPVNKINVSVKDKKYTDLVEFVKSLVMVNYIEDPMSSSIDVWIDNVSPGRSAGASYSFNIVNAVDNTPFLTMENKTLPDLKEALENYYVSKELRKADFNDKNLDVRIEFVPVKNSLDNFADINDYIKEEELQVTPYDTVLVKVTNYGTKDAYYNILDFQPDGVINVIAPDPYTNERPESYFIKAGESKIIPNLYLEFGEPYGNEVFKVFASGDVIDLRAVHTTRGKSSRAYTNPLERFIQNAYNVNTRGGKRNTIASNGNSFEYPFRIVEKRD